MRADGELEVALANVIDSSSLASSISQRLARVDDGANVAFGLGRCSIARPCTSRFRRDRPEPRGTVRRRSSGSFRAALLPDEILNVEGRCQATVLTGNQGHAQGFEPGFVLFEEA